MKRRWPDLRLREEAESRHRAAEAVRRAQAAEVARDVDEALGDGGDGGLQLFNRVIALHK